MLESLIGDFTRAGLLDDGQYAQAQVTSLRRRGYGAQAILLKLRAKGLPADLIRKTIEEETLDRGMDDFRAALRYVRRKRLGPYRKTSARPPGDDASLRNKELAALGRAGFGYDTAHKALAMSKDEIEEFLGV